MKVFMSWSGLCSKAVAELIANWAKCVIQATQPWISTSGIDRGAVWYSAINDELTNTSVGIICLTNENKNKPWILFEAGALAKGLVNSRVCTFLIDLKPSNLESPLAQFNHTTPDKDGLWNLARTLNNSVTVPLEIDILEQVFEIHWPKFETDLKAIIAAYPPNAAPEVRSNDSILMELLDASRSITTRLRAVEERVGRGPANRQRVMSVADLPRNSYDNSSDTIRGPSFSDGMTMAHQGFQSGMDRLEIQQKLYEAGFGRKGIQDILETLDQIVSNISLAEQAQKTSGTSA